MSSQRLYVRQLFPAHQSVARRAVVRRHNVVPACYEIHFLSSHNLLNAAHISTLIQCSMLTLLRLNNSSPTLHAPATSPFSQVPYVRWVTETGVEADFALWFCTTSVLRMIRVSFQVWIASCRGGPVPRCKGVG